MPDQPPPDFGQALEFANENLEVEFKRSLPLNDPVEKAKLAKEICALANQGGGWIVLGREDDGTYPNTLPIEVADVDQDQINQIAAAYLQPAPHCTVSTQQPDGVDFAVPVIWVPSCGTSPVCGKKNGPNDQRGRTQGVAKGVHYIRKAGPVSAPIETPDDWQDVVRRCVLADKTSLLGALSTMIEQPRPASETEAQSVFDADFEHMVDLWKKGAQEHPYKVDLANSFVAFGFHLVNADLVEIDQLRECLLRRPHIPHGGYDFFENRHKSRHPFVFEIADHAGLECRLNTTDFDQRAIWRLSEALSGAEVISYCEDTEWIKSAVEGRPSVTWDRGQHISIAKQITTVSCFLVRVKQIADNFNFAGDVRIRVLFSGLNGRNLKSPDPKVPYHLDFRACQNTKKVDFVLNVADLAAETRSSAIAKIIQPMNKLTQGPQVTAETVVKTLD